ncbi:hypothetical protein C2845_PM11G05490 [Panicum miliaceum]|uniref:PB1 domain-containing protein n=1 Tax=Panicum miliaceum TaxID=4540 RepID=A0A3L6RRZ0_PANMI|nr:hypothetical protein C2845_PM11G05490 [Panicum miliaceum]
MVLDCVFFDQQRVEHAVRTGERYSFLQYRDRGRERCTGVRYGERYRSRGAPARQIQRSSGRPLRAYVPRGPPARPPLPGEDLDALVSVTNDEDLEHLALEYDRLHLLRPAPGSGGGSNRGSTLRLRVFLFPVQSSPLPPQSVGLLETKPERHWFVEALNNVPQPKQETSPSPVPAQQSLPQQKQESVFVQQSSPPQAKQETVFVQQPSSPELRRKWSTDPSRRRRTPFTAGRRWRSRGAVSCRRRCSAVPRPAPLGAAAALDGAKLGHALAARDVPAAAAGQPAAARPRSRRLGDGLSRGNGREGPGAHQKSVLWVGGRGGGP